MSAFAKLKPDEYQTFSLPLDKRQYGSKNGRMTPPSGENKTISHDDFGHFMERQAEVARSLVLAWSKDRQDAMIASLLSQLSYDYDTGDFAAYADDVERVLMPHDGLSFGERKSLCGLDDPVIAKAMPGSVKGAVIRPGAGLMLADVSGSEENGIAVVSGLQENAQSIQDYSGELLGLPDSAKCRVYVSKPVTSGGTVHVAVGYDTDCDNIGYARKCIQSAVEDFIPAGNRGDVRFHGRIYAMTDSQIKNAEQNDAAEQDLQAEKASLLRRNARAVSTTLDASLVNVNVPQPERAMEFS